MSGDRCLHNPVAVEAGLERLAETYARFSENEARERSVLYQTLARSVAADQEMLQILADLPPPKQQPNLLFAAVRYVCGTAEDWQQFRGWFFGHREEILAVIQSRRTQTNEPARCATLLPLLATIPQPLALLEVGAAAGLCLLPDYYAYDFDGHEVAPSHSAAPDTPTFSCHVNEATPLPAQNVEVAWRAGLDLEPIDVRDGSQVAWLEALVWPGEGERLELLRRAIDVAKTDPPSVLRGDLRHDLPALAARAPTTATLVIFHTAVLAYLPEPAERAAFGEMARSLDAIWVANEGPGVQTGLTAPHPPCAAGSDPFLLTRDECPIAWTDPHGTSIHWIGG